MTSQQSGICNLEHIQADPGVASTEDTHHYQAHSCPKLYEVWHWNCFPQSQCTLQNEVNHFLPGWLLCIPRVLPKAQALHVTSPINPFLHFSFLPGLSHPSCNNLSLAHLTCKPPNSTINKYLFIWKVFVEQIVNLLAKTKYPFLSHDPRFPKSFLSQGSLFCHFPPSGRPLL